MGLFGENSDDEDEDEQEGETLIHQVVRLKVEEAVDEANTWIHRVNREGWDLYLFPDDPTLEQVRKIDDELKRLYDKISENRPCDKEERAKVLHARQAVRELLEIYAVYDSISVPVEPSSPNSGEDDGGNGGVTNAV